MSEEATLRELNIQYLASYMTGNVGWYQEHLAEEFVCTKSDGSTLDKPQFLRQTAAGPDVSEYRLERVRVKVDGETATVDGTGSYSRADVLAYRH